MPRPRTTILLVLALVMTVPAVAVANHFTDVPANHTHKAGIDYMEETGITAGCTPTEFCPGDTLTRGQMATFMLRASGHDPQTPPSVNAAELDGQGPSAYTTSVFTDSLDGNVSLDGHTSVATAATVLTVPDLPAGEYVINGHVLGSSQGTDSSRTICRIEVGGDFVSHSINRVGTTGGQSSQLTFPVSGHATVESGTEDLELLCHAENVTGSAPRISGSNARTHVIAIRVGDAS